ncbi:hypothetical protein IQ269_01545 [Tychonema sp. LEGE 07199]|uniref:HTH domain-containing protein n=1 Tax=unclassified Tychonema TaxID=2642144 RepID=UPI0018824588|nr:MULTISPECIES: hypothetical protein [unclassified Tychonema]MBE9119516.1 hypothetical protein [Tychonema sp. LEGE 07199]MBE9130712.1 hypothetical protein [Tychonema sp. LEGE 07196]
MVSSRVNPNFPPPFYELGEYDFQDMCCDVFDVEPGIATCNVYGTRGQEQHGIDLLAHCDDGIHIEVVQCKCYKKFPPPKIKEASDDFLKHIDYWRSHKVKRFILLVGCELTETKQQQEILAQKQRFVTSGIQYEVWSASILRNKLSPHRAIVYRYLKSQEWAEKICGTVLQQYPQSPEISQGTQLAFGVLSSKIGHLSSELSKEKAKQLDAFRELYRQGYLQRAFACLKVLRDDPNWEVFEKPLQAKILQSLSSYILSVEHDIEKAKKLAEQARAILPEGDDTFLQALISYHTQGAEAALRMISSPSSIDIFNLELSLLLELGRTEEVITKLQTLPQGLEPDAETNRIHALALLDKGDIASALIKIQQARYEKPNWENIRASEATIHYFSILSPAIPKQLIDFPQPVDWSLIKRDDESLQRLRKAAKEYKQLVSQTERGEEQRKYWQIWHLACLANDPERQSEAHDLCSALITEDPTNPQAIIWRTARNYDIDLSTSQKALKALVQEGSKDLARIVALLGIYLYLDTPQPALELLHRTRETFEQTGHQDVWLIWHIQTLAIDGDVETALQESETFSNPAVRRSIRAAILREQARVNGNWQAFAEYLETCWQESRNGQYLAKACQLQASLQDWAYVADRADDLVNSVGTPDALSLAAQCAGQAGRFEQCFQLLNDHQKFFPGSNLPPYLRRLRANCQAKLGLISEAVADAQELVRSHETVENLVNLMNLYLNQGDLRGLAMTACRLLRQEDVHPISWLWAGRCLLSEDPGLARQLWQKAVTAPIEAEVLGEVISLGYKLGLDREIEPFVRQAQILAMKGEGPFQAVRIKELLELQQKWAENAALINQKYHNAELPIHFIAQIQKLALTHFFHILPRENANNPNPHYQAAVLARYGARPFPEGFADSNTQWRLHLDISALLLAAHLGILDAVEQRFSPIRVSVMLPAALLQEGEHFVPHQPSQLDSYRQILQLNQSGKLHEIPQSLNIKSDELIEKLGKQSAILLEKACVDNGFVVEFLPLERLDADGVIQPVVLDETYRQRFINCRALVEALKEQGVLSKSAYETAVKNLGDESSADLPPKLPTRNDLICLNSELALLLAGSDLLTRVCCYFRVFVTHQCVCDARVALNDSESSAKSLRWLGELRERVSTGLERGIYEAIVLPDAGYDRELELQQSSSANELTAYHLFTHTPQLGDALWIDDRFFSQYPHRDSRTPIIGVLEILEALQVSDDLSETKYYEKILQLRAGNIRYIPITTKEILYHLKQASVRDGRVLETEDLATIRRYVASCLLDSHRLQRPPMSEGSISPEGEIRFVFECFSATEGAISNVWADINFSQEIAAAYSDWILANLYTGTFGVRHLWPNVDSNSDGLDLISTDICQLYLRGIQLRRIEIENNDNRETLSRCQQYFNWLEQRITENRFRGNPEIVTSVARLIKDIILHQGWKQEWDESLQVIRLIWEEFYRVLPSILKEEMKTHPELMAYLQIQIVESINLTLPDLSAPLVFPASDFFAAIATSVNGEEANLAALQPQVTFKIRAVQDGSSIQFCFINQADLPIYSWHDDVMLLTSNDPNVREQVLRSHRFWFDCDNATFERVVSEIVSTTDSRKRVDQANEWREHSAAVFYSSFEEKLHQNHNITIDDLIPPSGAGLLRHFHLKQYATESLSFREKLSRAAESLLAAEGLEICIERLSCLPVKLPVQVREELRKLPSSERWAVLKRLSSRLISPVCKLHLIDLALLSPDSTALVQDILDELYGEVGELQFRLFQAILNLLSGEFSYWHEAKKWLPSMRLAMIWAQASKLYNLLYHPTIPLEEFAQRLENYSKHRPINADFLDRNPEFWNDVLHPRRLSRMALAVHGLAAILAEHNAEVLKAVRVAEKMIAFAVITIEDQQYLTPELINDYSTLAQDNLGSFLGGNRSEYLVYIFGQKLGKEIICEDLKAIVENAIDDAFLNPSVSREKWQLILFLIGDLPIYKDLAEKLSNLLNNLKMVDLYRAEPSTLFYALRVASAHAVNSGDENLRSKLEQQLVEIAGLINTQEQQELVSHEIANHILESALSLAARANDPRTTSHSLNILLERIVSAWPRFTSVCANRLSRVVQELPANQLHGGWKIVLLLRALRNNE